MNICQHYGIKTDKTHLKHHPDTAIKNKEVKVLWDSEIQTDKVMPTQRQDVVVIDKTE